MGDWGVWGILALYMAGIGLILAELLMPTVIFGVAGLACVMLGIALAFVTGQDTLGIWLVVLTLVLTRFVHRAVIDPVKHVGEACAQVTMGNFETRVNINRRDELFKAISILAALLKARL